MDYYSTLNTTNRSYDGTLSSAILSNGEFVSRSWQLSVTVRMPASQYHPLLIRVDGSLTVGKLMHEIVRSLPSVQADWSKYNLWWPEKNQWVQHTRSTLDQYGIQSDARLEFRSSFYPLNVVLPSLVTQTVSVDYSARVFQVVKSLCKQFDIRHFEELSLCFPATREDLKFNTPLPIINHGTKKRLPIINNKQVPAKQAFDSDLILKPKNLVQKARINSGWLDSSRSLLQHGIDPLKDNLPTPSLCLKFKFFAFYDLNPKYDQIRIHQLFEQARWSILAGHIDCTEDEAYVFAAYQLQAKLKSSSVEVNNNFDTISHYQTMTPPLLRQESMFEPPGSQLPPLQLLDETIDSMISDLEKQCESPDDLAKTNAGITLRSNAVIKDEHTLLNTPELTALMSVCRDKVLFLKRRYRQMFVRVRELFLYLYRGHEDQHPMCVYSLKDCNATPEIDPTRQVYVIKLSVLSSGEKQTREELILRCNSKEQYAKFISAFRLGSKGRTQASSAEFNKEVAVVLEMLNLQMGCGGGDSSAYRAVERNISDLMDYLPERIMNKGKTPQQLISRIAEVFVKIRELDMTASKLQYIKAWKELPDFGRTFFLVHFDKVHCQVRLRCSSFYFCFTTMTVES
ncbi:Fermitin member 3 [Cichlidogyrus casuarinus]|uniref:Fermitin member 3 n=1 Tax=Cichlidogyrus casuarinus TaxID=1844966 RepID=A0ABD2Q8D5_9PLAT